MIEHLNPIDVDKAVVCIFQKLRPISVFITTPNQEYNSIIQDSFGKSNQQFRHSDHKFEWKRSEFHSWCMWICENYGYTSTIGGIGKCVNDNDDGTMGSASHYAFFTRDSSYHWSFSPPIMRLYGLSFNVNIDK